jgi:hypothetical protein
VTHLVKLLGDVVMAAVESLSEELGEVLIREEGGKERELAEDDQRVDHQAREVPAEDVAEVLPPDLRVVTTRYEEQVPGKLTDIAVVALVVDPGIHQRDNPVRDGGGSRGRGCPSSTVGIGIVLQSMSQGLLRARDPELLKLCQTKEVPPQGAKVVEIVEQREPPQLLFVGLVSSLDEARQVRQESDRLDSSKF